MPYAIARAEKLKTPGQLAAVSGHLDRSRPTPNADPNKPPKVSFRLGASSVPEAVARRLEEAGVDRVRADQVRAIQLVLTASPEHFRPDAPAEAGAWDRARTKAWHDAALGWAQEHFGPRNVVAATLHIDEATPHLHVIAVPVDDTPRQRGPQVRLNAKRWLGGADRLSAMQDSYAAALAPLGLERGRRRSKARHEPLKRFYGRMQEAAQEARHSATQAAQRLTAATGLLDATRRLHGRAEAAARSLEGDQAAKVGRALDQQAQQADNLGRRAKQLQDGAAGAVAQPQPSKRRGVASLDDD